MTTPYWGNPISIGDVEDNVWGYRFGLGMDWIRSNTKDSITDLNNCHDRAWYQKNNAGNCNNGNCPTGNCACGDGAGGYVNCYISSGINCTNCDGRAWLQPNCNCACSYNCWYAQWPQNCNCACYCDCNCGG